MLKRLFLPRRTARFSTPESPDALLRLPVTSFSLLHAAFLLQSLLPSSCLSSSGAALSSMKCHAQTLHGRDKTELLEHVEHVINAPLFRDLAVFDADNIDGRDRHLLASWGMLPNAPCWVPRSVKRTTTLFPSAIMSSTVTCMSGKAVSIMPMSCLDPSGPTGEPTAPAE